MSDDQITINRMQLTILTIIVGYVVASVVAFFNLKSDVRVLQSNITQIEKFLTGSN